MSTRHNQARTIAVLLDPEGGEHPCNLMLNGTFWAAGMVDVSPQKLADRIHEAWFRNDPEPESTYAHKEWCIGEQP